MPLASGTRLGPYEIVALLDRGGMGDVYRARDERLDRELAIKTLSATFANDPDRLARFEREARMLAALNHPNIGAIYGIEYLDDAPYLLLELVEGETLAARLARGRMETAAALAICGQIAAAIEAAHERGIVHRDLKPKNVMVGPTGHVKVLDFGLARSEAIAAPDDDTQAATAGGKADLTEAGLVIGTAAYMSPEQARGRPVDRRSDVWSFGCVTFECLAGAPAFAGETTSDLLARILEREPDWKAIPERVPVAAREIVKRCLRKDAETRPRDIRDVRLALSEIADGRPPGESANDKTIAVLPFDNLSAPDDEYFSDGITDEILNALAHVEGLRVPGRTSCFAFKGRREDLREIGDKLAVATVLEGTVRRSGSRLRITAQLVNVADGFQLWSERYDREMTDVFAVQDEIAAAIIARLRGTMDAQSQRTRARRATHHLEAYELLLKGRALQAKRGRFLPQAIACLERAIELDPQYAEAMASLSDSYRLRGTFGLAPYVEVMTRARDIAERALAIDPGLAEAWSTLACVAEQYEHDYPRARTLWEHALGLDPRDARARVQRALWGYCRGEWSTERTIAEVARAVEDDPLNSWVAGMRSHVLGFVGMYEASMAEAERALALDPESFFTQWNAMRSYAWAGRHERAVAMAPEILADSGRHIWVLGVLAWTHAKMGHVDLAHAIYDEMHARSRQEFTSPFWLAVAASAAGLGDTAMEWVARAVAERDPLVVWGRTIPLWDTLREDPRLDEVVRPFWT